LSGLLFDQHLYLQIRPFFFIFLFFIQHNFKYQGVQCRCDYTRVDTHFVTVSSDLLGYHQICRWFGGDGPHLWL